MYRHSAHALKELFVQGELSAQEIATATLKRILTYDPKIGAFLSVFNEHVEKKAQELDRKRAQGKKLGKLAGVPIAIKDNIHVKGALTTCASKFLQNYEASFDATAVRLLEQEDALIIGKTNLDEFAMGSSTENSAMQVTRNPWDLACTPGGSSGGSAAAVAARLCPVALGSDTGGSIRQPAAFSGVVGYKPTYGRVSRYGLVAFGSSLDQIGPLATCVKDAALVMEVIGRHCEKDSTSADIPVEAYTHGLNPQALQKSIIGIPKSFLEDLAVEAKTNFLESIATLKNLGATLVDVELDFLRYSIAVYYILATAEASTNLARFDGIRYGKRSLAAKSLDEIYDFSRSEGFGGEVKNRILLGTYLLSSRYQDAYYRKAQKVRTLVIRQLEKAFSQCHVIAMPCSPFPAFPLGSIQDPLQMYLQDIYTICANLAGLPAISLPAGFNKEKKPLGLQLIGPQMQDRLVLQLAYAFEQNTPYSQQIPPLFV